ncbi:MAG: hypothetical protein HFF18_00800 [Oscillospiraceae bacterium]|nr:hypothetical protein [Oscillospiraceae bacterium]
MKKQRIRFTAILLLLALAVTGLPAAWAAGNLARAGNIDLTLNGTPLKLGAYNIGGNNYVKLRDVAQLLVGTGKQFSIAWNGEAQRIDLTSGASYLPVGGELFPLAAGDQYAAPSSASVWLDGAEAALTAYTINGNNFFKLRDLGAALNFYVGWDGVTNTVIVDTSKSYEAEELPAAVNQSAMAQAMLAVLPPALDDLYGDACLADVDGDGVVELIVACEPAAYLYDWQNGQLTSKEIGTLAGGYFLWYLCQNTATGERGLQFESVGGGDFGGGDTTYYYSAYEVHIGDRTYFNDEGVKTGEYYYIGDYENEVTKADYLAIRSQHQTLERISGGWWDLDAQLAVIRAGLEVMRDGKALNEISDEGLLALAKIAAKEIPSMVFELDTGSIVPKDTNDYILVNLWGDFGEVHAYRVPGCTTAAEVEAAVNNIWHQKFSRRYPVSYTASVIEYSGQPGDYMGGDLLRYNGALYVVENYGIGDGGFEWTVDRMISRTADEALFHGHDYWNEYGEEITLALIYEDGVWKYTEFQ